jgi:hypothetical protein
MAINQYSGANIGIDYGPDGKLGGGDDKIYVSGDSATNLVDEIISLAAGGFYYNQTSDFPTAPTGLTHQGTLNWADDFITKNDNYANSNTMGFYMYDYSGALITSAKLRFNLTDQPTLFFTETGDQLGLSWAGLGFALENSPTVGPTANWTAVPGGTNSPVKATLSGKTDFWRLHQQ